MALRQIREQGDPCLSKECKPVKKMTERTLELIDDMFETMYENDGCGIAAPQVGILKQICVVDVGDGEQYLFINPEITLSEGAATDNEGCLSVPGYTGAVERATHIIVKAYDENLEPFELEASDFLARAIQHEIDHLHGVLYTDKVIGDLYKVKPQDEEAENEPAVLEKGGSEQ